MFKTITLADAIPSEGEFEIVNDGQVLGGVVVHPRQAGQWMAMMRPKDWRGAGMKRYRTRAGAVRCVVRATQGA